VTAAARFVFQDARFALSRGAELPTEFGQQLRWFTPYVPLYDPDEVSVRLFDGVGPVRSALVEWPVFAAVFDLVSDEGGLRLVVPEVQLRSREHGFVAKWLLSDDLVRSWGRGL
jgi:hypothetical protein